MLLGDLKAELLQTYDLICFVDIADFRQKHRSIFDLFKDVRRDRFDANQRLVFYSAYEPEKEFIDHIQRAAVKIDISNFFILIVCPYDITDKLSASNKKFGHDYSVIHSLTRALEHTKKFDPPGFVKNDSLCPLPFSQALVNLNGNVSPCCKFRGGIGNLRSMTLQEAFYSDRADVIRDQFRHGIGPKECSVCWQNESAGTTSHRELALQKYGALLDQGWLDDVRIRDLTLAPSTLCNFRCRICSAKSSSSIAAEEIQHALDPDQKKYFKQLMSYANHNTQYVDIVSELPQLIHLDYLHILGGEPLMWPQLPDLLNTLVDHDLARQITLELHTNCSLYPEPHMLNMFERFRALEVLLSVDNVGSRFEIERGGKWPDILQNIKKFACLRSSQTTVKLAVTVNLQNVLYLDDLIELAKTLEIDIVWLYLESPEFLCIDQATAATRDAVHAKYRHHQEIELQKISTRMLNCVGSDGREFVEYTKKIDLRRSQCFFETHPEIYSAMGGCV